MNTWCYPKIDEKHEIGGSNITHPLLRDSVPNDFSLKNRAMITGANASGKSTFMKAVAINVILAQTIHTCAAITFHTPPLMVMTCMSLRDDILSGESYYVRESKYLKRIIDKMEKESPILCVIDEILKGTNTKERLSASAAVLNYIARTESFVLVATHDIELTMDKKYEHYYFESQITVDDILFDYKLKKGNSSHSNAIALLKILNFPNEVIEQAEKNMRKVV